jgi:hypothetical protein
MDMDEETIKTLSKVDLPRLEALRDKYEALGDQQSVSGIVRAIHTKGQVQTEELSRCGKLFEHHHIDPRNGQHSFTYTGDMAEFMAPFVRPPMTCRINRGIGTGENSPEAKALRASQVTVTLKPGETVKVVKG